MSQQEDILMQVLKDNLEGGCIGKVEQLQLEGHLNSGKDLDRYSHKCVFSFPRVLMPARNPSVTVKDCWLGTWNSILDSSFLDQEVRELLSMQ